MAILAMAFLRGQDERGVAAFLVPTLRVTVKSERCSNGHEPLNINCAQLRNLTARQIISALMRATGGQSAPLPPLPGLDIFSSRSLASAYGLFYRLPCAVYCLRPLRRMDLSTISIRPFSLSWISDISSSCLAMNLSCRAMAFSRRRISAWLRRDSLRRRSPAEASLPTTRLVSGFKE
jgi:hypothetical protein